MASLRGACDEAIQGLANKHWCLDDGLLHPRYARVRNDDQKPKNDSRLVYINNILEINPMKHITIFVSILTLFFSVPAFAYIDPGSGSAILSAIAGLFVAITIAIKGYWYKLKSFFMRFKKDPKKITEKES